MLQQEFTQIEVKYLMITPLKSSYTLAFIQGNLKGPYFLAVLGLL